MFLLAGRLFLLLLLGVVWATAPTHGTSPLSHVLSIQEAVSLSFGYRQDVRDESSPFAHPPFLALPLAFVPPGASAFLHPPGGAPPATPGDDVVYALLSIRC